MRRRVGVGGIQKKRLEDKKFEAKGDELAENQVNLCIAFYSLAFFEVESDEILLTLMVFSWLNSQANYQASKVT